MVATYIFSGLRREEGVWLTVDDIDYTLGNYGVIHIRAKRQDPDRPVPGKPAEAAAPEGRCLNHPQHVGRSVRKAGPADLRSVSVRAGRAQGRTGASL